MLPCVQGHLLAQPSAQPSALTRHEGASGSYEVLSETEETEAEETKELGVS